MRPISSPASRVLGPRLAPWGLAVLFALGGCGPGRAGSLSAPRPSPACVAFAKIGSAPGPTDTLTVGFTRAVDPAGAPAPSDPDEAFLFRLLYEPLVRLDCRGRRYPGLAEGWERKDGGRRWVFTLRRGARFWDGTPVRASDVVASWRDVRWRAPLPVEWPPSGVAVVDSVTLAVAFPEPVDQVPAVLARPELAVVRRAPGEPWPVLGTGAYRVSETSELPRNRLSGGAAPIRSILLRARTGGDGLPGTLEIRVAPGADGRDLLDSGTDLLLTGGRATLAYARLRPGLVVHPLPWSETYALAVPRTRGGGPAAPVPGGFLRTLAGEVSPSEARPASGVPEGGGGATPGAHRDAGSASPAPWIGFPVRDPVARALAGRIVALAASPPATRAPDVEAALRALGLAEAPRSLRSEPLEPRDATTDEESGGLGVVVRIPRAPAEEGGVGCVAAVPPGGGTPPEPAAAGRSAGLRVPLVETRRSVILRGRGPAEGVGMGVDCDGTPFLLPGRGG